MTNILGQSWLTTVIGIIGAIANAIVPLLRTGTITTQELINSIIIAALGAAAKSFNVSGVSNASEKKEN